jgi:heme O synthase-like polyprenyltransferase
VIAMIVISLVQYMLKLRKNTDSNEYARQLYMYSIIIFIFNLICVSILQVILDCFAVDG